MGAIALVIAAIMSACSSSPSASSKPAANAGPFALAADPVAAAKAAGVRMLPREGTKVHYHPQLTVNVNGEAIPVPANIGIGQREISELHTHDMTGRIHIEAEQAGTFTLKQLMTEWGVTFDDRCIATFCTDADNELRVYDDGQLAPNPSNVVLKEEGQQILLWYGPKSAKPDVPTRGGGAAAPGG